MKQHKTYLILVNAAYKMGEFHVNIGNYIKSSGNKVIYAFTDKLPFYTERFDISNDKYYIFSDFFMSNYDNVSIKPKYKEININKLYFSDFDRNVVHQKMKAIDDSRYESLMPNLINFFDTIISENKIDICIYESISNSFAYTAFEVLKLNDIPYCGYAGSRLSERFELYSEEFGSINDFEIQFLRTDLKNVSKQSYEYAVKFLSKFTSGDEMPTYHPKGTYLDWNHSILKKYFNLGKMRLIFGSFKFLINESRSIKYSYQIGNPVLELLRSFSLQMKKQIRIKIATKYFDEPNDSDKYFVYPQHFKPESSTSVLARHYCDDVALITNIAFNLPPGTKLYIKEHFVNFGRMPNSYYQTLRKIPNVKLISHQENIKLLITKSVGVITLTSTVGFEALLYNKPVFIFGNVFYQCHPNCFKINSYNDISKLLKSKAQDATEINKRFLVAYYNHTYSGIVYYNLENINFDQDKFNKQYIGAINEKYF